MFTHGVQPLHFLYDITSYIFKCSETHRKSPVIIFHNGHQNKLVGTQSRVLKWEHKVFTSRMATPSSWLSYWYPLLSNIVSCCHKCVKLMANRIHCYSLFDKKYIYVVILHAMTLGIPIKYLRTYILLSLCSHKN